MCSASVREGASAARRTLLSHATSDFRALCTPKEMGLGAHMAEKAFPTPYTQNVCSEVLATGLGMQLMPEVAD